MGIYFSPYNPGLTNRSSSTFICTIKTPVIRAISQYYYMSTDSYNALITNETTLNLIENYQMTAIRGNISEIKAIAKLTGVIDENNTAKGVDVNADDIITEENLAANGEIIKELAKKLNTTVLASGPIDILSDGETTIAIDNGDDMMPLITGSGCMLSSIVGSCVGGSTPLEGTLVAILAMNLAGEKARAKVDEKDEGTGSFRTYLIDYLYKTNAESLVEESNIMIL